MNSTWSVLVPIFLLLAFVAWVTTNVGPSPTKKTRRYDDWKAQGELVVFQKKDESRNDAMRRLSTGGVLVPENEEQEPIIVRDK